MRKKKDDSNPGTEAFVPDFDDDDETGATGEAENTGTHSWVPDFDDDTGEHPATEKPESSVEPVQPVQPIQPAEPVEQQPEAEPAGTPVQSVTVPGRYLYVKWWKLALVILGSWAAAAVVGLGLFSWWYHSIDKTSTLFVVLVYVVASIVGGVMLAMVEGRPLVSALSVAVMSGPFAALLAAAPLYGYHYCARVGHCLVGVLPY